MSFKVAVASSDGKFINQHFGMASQFLIFEIKDDGTYEFLELRENKPACSVDGHSDLSMGKSIELISDCEAVIASQIGPGAIDILISREINPYIAPTFIDEALKEISKLKNDSDEK
ncbi:MAG: dinitrogenase iron-molybdenum cofactor biosynthesis protein [Methanobacteriales archaeon Met13]